MPELPEVETLRKGLEHYLVGYTIQDIDFHGSKQFHGEKSKVIGAKIIGVRRFGKGLVIDLSNHYSLAIHIKLTGQLIYRNEKLGIKNKEGREEVPNKFTHIVFHLDNLPSHSEAPAIESPEIKKDPIVPSGLQDDKKADSYLYYNDVRQFGWIKVVKSEKLKEQNFFKDLGPEFPLVKGDQESLTWEQFSQILSKSTQPVKVVIMDQKKMAGVGNIYANDGLYLAKIDPRRKANSLTSGEKERLFKAIETVLKKGLQEGGASELTFVNILGEKGNYQNHSLIYGKKGKKCPHCGTIIKKITLGGRGTYICEDCQR